MVARLAAGTAGGTVLDVGCGRGLTVEALRRQGVDCVGVELAPVEPLEAVRPYVFAGQDVFALPEDLRRRVTAILLLDVVEHLAAPEEFLATLAARFDRLERIVVTVPARAELWSNYDEFYGHVRRYDRASLRALLEPVGRGGTSSGYFFHALYPVLRLALALRPDRPIAHAAPRARWAHRLAAGLLALEQRALPRSWWGTSLWGVAER